MKELEILGWDKIKPCLHPEHNFPTMLYIPPGTSYTHKCPACGCTITVHQPMVWA